MFIFFLLLGVGALLLVYIIMRSFTGADPRALAKALRWVGGAAIIVLASGLTLLDLRQPGIERTLNMSHIAARQEVRELLAAVGMDGSPVAGTS